MTEKKLNDVLDKIGRDYRSLIQRGSRHYLEVSLAKHAEQLGYDDLKEKYKDAWVIIPLRSPQQGMKVRIDGRTFTNYAQHDSGMALPGYLARQTGRPYTTFVPEDSMICNFT